jgi:hypothetical protein
MAMGMPPTQMLHHVVDTDMTQLFKRRGPFRTVREMYTRLATTAPWKWLMEGLIDTSAYGDLLLSLIGDWPEKFWTIASSKGMPILFDSCGTFTFEHAGPSACQKSLKLKLLNATVAPINVAICATIAIPGLLSSVLYDGRQLHDGALTPFGECQHIVPIIAYGAEPKDIVCFEIGGDRFSEGFLTLGRLLTGGSKRIEICARLYQRSTVPDDSLVITLPRLKINSLDFTISDDNKKLILLSGFRHSCTALNKTGLLSDQNLAEAMANSEQWSDFEQLMKEVEQKLLK